MVLVLFGFYEYEGSATSQLNGTFNCQLDLAGFYEFGPRMLFLSHICFHMSMLFDYMTKSICDLLWEQVACDKGLIRNQQ